MIEQESDGSHSHDGRFRQFDQTDNASWRTFRQNCLGQRREQKGTGSVNRKCTEVDPDRAVTFDGQPIENGEDQRLFKHVIVKRAERLRGEERQNCRVRSRTVRSDSSSVFLFLLGMV